MLKGKISEEYYNGVVGWIRKTFENDANPKEGGRILCPCKRCRGLWSDADGVLDHLVLYGFRNDHEKDF